MTTIDYHIHWWPPAFLEYLEKSDKPSKNLPPLPLLTAPPVADLGLRAKLMDKAGIDVAVLSQPMQPDARIHPDLAELSNDGFAEIVSDRFRFFASLPLPLIDESVAELNRALAMDGCDGVILPTHVFGGALDDDKFEPLLAALNDQEVTVALHPDAFRAEGVLAQWFMDWSIGAPFEDTIVALRLISSGRVDQFPDIKWIVPHAGGTLPVLWQRMDKQYASVGGEVLGFTKQPSEYANHFIYDTATQTAETLALAVGEIGGDRLVMGTDFPFIDFADMGAAVRTVENCAALTPDEAEAVLAGTAAHMTDFLWRDGDRKIRFGRGAIRDTDELIEDGFVLFTTERARDLVPGLADRADDVLIVPSGLVDEISEDLLQSFKGDRAVALGGGRVVDTAKAIGAVTGAWVGAIPTTLSGAEMTPIHRLPTSAPSGTRPIRPRLVINDPALTASQPPAGLAASAANALAHAIEGRVTVRSSPVPAMAAEEATRLIDIAFYTDEPSRGDRDKLALGALLAGYTTDSTGIALHHVMAQTLVRVGGVEHAASNAVLLPHTIGALERRNPGYVDPDGTLKTLALKLARLAGTERIRDLGTAESALAESAKAAAARDVQLALTPPAADEAELLAIYQAAW